MDIAARILFSALLLALMCGCGIEVTCDTPRGKWYSFWVYACVASTVLAVLALVAVIWTV